MPEQRTGRRVLIGSAGTATSWGVLAGLRDVFPDAFALAVDMQPAHRIAAAAEADAFAVVPAVSDPGYEERLFALLAEHRIDTYLPTHDPEVVLAAGWLEQGRLEGIACPAPPRASAELCWDKLALSARLAAAGVPAPRTLPLTEVEDGSAGWFVKPRRGVGSIGVAAVRSARELDRVGESGDELVAQPLLQPPEITVDAFLGASTAAAVCRERVEVKAGVSTKARVFHDDRLERIALDAGRLLGLRGAATVQLMHDASGRPFVTDLNPRPGAGTRLSSAVGFDVHAATFAELWGLDPEPYLRRLDRERWVVRVHREIVLA